MTRDVLELAIQGIRCSVLALVCAAVPARADAGIQNAWIAAYPGSTADDAVAASTGSVCALCHFTPADGDTWNAYGWKLRELLRAGQSVSAAFANAGPPNSDLDPAGWSNLAEIERGSQPGWTQGPNNTRYEKTVTIPGQPPPPTMVVVLDPPCGAVPANCGVGTSLSGCVPAITSSGFPSALATSGFTVTATGMDGQRNGGFFFGLTYAPIRIGAAGGGTSSYCGPAPRQRMRPFGNTNGTIGACDGSRSRDLNDWFADNGDGLGAPYFAGQTIYVQGWNRDGGNPSADLNLTDGLAVTLCP